MSDTTETMIEKTETAASPKSAKGAKKGATKGAKKARKTGQSGPEIEVKVDELNAKETKVLDCLNGKGAGAREIISIPDLTKVFKNTADTKAQANSWVRNSLRRLICANYIEKVERGSYRITESGRKRLQRAEA